MTTNKFLDNNVGLPKLWELIGDKFAEKTDVPSAYTNNPAMDGTASAGSSSSYAKGDHVHPTDTTRAPIDHKSTSTDYGVGNSASYGHLKLSDATNNTTNGVSNGIAATPKAVSTALQSAKDYADSVAGSDTTYSFTTGSVGSASSWSAGSVASFVVEDGTLKITTGTAPSLTVTPTTVVTSATED